MNSVTMYKCILLCFSFLVCGSIAGHAPFIKPCTKTDFACMLESARATVPHLVNGVKEIGLPPLDPLQANDITTNSGDLNLSFRNMVARGLSKCKINNVERDAAKSTGFLDIECPISVVGDYKASGKLIFLDVEGEGPFKIEGGTMHGNITIKLKPFTKDGKQHYKISGFDFLYEPTSKFTFIFENLFKGDKEKAKAVEHILNESWRELIVDPNIGRRVIEAALGQLVNIINLLFHWVPADELEIA